MTDSENIASREVEPFEARRLPELPDTPAMRQAFTDLLVAVNGFPYQGDTANAIAYTLRWLRANPLAAAALLAADSAGFQAAVRESLARVDGSVASAVALLANIPVDQLGQYGGVSEESRD